MIIKLINRASLRCVAILCVLITIVLVESARSSEFDSPKDDGDNRKALSLVGFNYTNRIIESYTIDYASGGDIQLSSPTTGGGGNACCFNYYPIEKMQVKVRWQANGCVYTIKSPVTKVTADVRHLFYREKVVEVERKTAGMPEFIETHIFPDGSVKVFLTASLSFPVLRLNAERADKSYFPRCKDGKKPKE